MASSQSAAGADLSHAPLPDEDGAVYRFRFLDDAQVARDEATFWFNVPAILEMTNGPAMLAELQKRGLEGDALHVAYTALDRLHRAVHYDNVLNYYEEESQDIERVLNIFIRLNSGGTILSYSDLLLSIAVAQWKKIDARSEIHRLVDELNRLGTGFNLSQDFVLKAGLMLTDIASVGFKVENFTTENMAKLEANWPTIRNSLLRTVELAASFGLNGQTLRADSALLPIAYYLYRRNAESSYVTHSRHASDRELIRGWLTRSLLKASGIWGSGLDTLLTSIRDVIRASDANEFPVSGVRLLMSQRGKSLSFEAAEVDDMLHMEYGDKRMFSLLSLLFPFVDLRNQFHMDHVFPISRFTPARLRKEGVAEERIEAFVQRANQLPNLQLLEGLANIEKRAQMPADWLVKQFPDPMGRKHYREMNMLGEVPDSIGDFEKFVEARRESLRKRLSDLLADAAPI